MTDRCRQEIDRYWKSEMCFPSEFHAGEAAVHCTVQRLYSGVQLFLRGKLLIVASPPHLVASVTAGVRGSPIDRIFTVDFLARLLGPARKCVLGPAHIHYADGSAGPFLSSGSCRLLTPGDAAGIRVLLGALDAAEREESGLEIDDAPAFGAFADHGVLGALASYGVWEPNIAHIRVAAHPRYRRRGHGRRAVSTLAAHALARNLIPQYRALAVNESSLRLAESLGFERYCSTIYARLPNLAGAANRTGNVQP